MINICKNGFGPLYLASESGHESIVKLLLNKGADVNLCNEKGIGPLCVACRNGHDSIVHIELTTALMNIYVTNKDSVLFM